MTAQPQPPTGGPTSLAELQAVYERIHRGVSTTSLGRNGLRILGQLLDAPHQAAMYSVNQLAETAGVNASTLSRLAQRLGYSGFSELQTVFRRGVEEREHFYSERADRLLRPSPPAGHSGVQLADTLAQQVSANIARCVHTLDGPQLDAIVELLATAPRVRLHGMRQFASLAAFMTYGLGMLRPDVALLDPANLGVADALAQLNDSDVLLVASCMPYTRATVDAARAAARHGITVVAITDSVSSPLAAWAVQSLYIPDASAYYSNSMCGFTFIAETLMTLVAQRLGEAAPAALRQREAFIRELNTEL